jgi:hypothetical protein
LIKQKRSEHDSLRSSFAVVVTRDKTSVTQQPCRYCCGGGVCVVPLPLPEDVPLPDVPVPEELLPVDPLVEPDEPAPMPLLSMLL